MIRERPNFLLIRNRRDFARSRLIAYKGDGDMCIWCDGSRKKRSTQFAPGLARLLLLSARARLSARAPLGSRIRPVIGPGFSDARAQFSNMIVRGGGVPDIPHT